MKYKINTYINNEDNSARFVLGFDNSNPLIFVGINPSTAFGDSILKYHYLKQYFADIIDISTKNNLNWKQIGSITSRGNPRHQSRGSYNPLNNFDASKFKR